MYQCSDAFHTAVAEGKEQMPLLIFENAVFTREDIDVESGIEFDDSFCTDTDVAIGKTPSNEIRFAIFNDDRLLNNYKFGEFTATIGVLIAEKGYTQSGSVMVTTGKAQYIGADERPYLRRNGTAVAVQPTFAVKALLGYDGKLWAFGDSGQCAAYNDSTGAIIANSKINSFMRNKVKTWSGKGIYYNTSSRMLFIYEAGNRKQYEFVPLGVFDADRPNVPDQIRIDMDCFDRMQKFDKDMPSASELGISYPTTIKTLMQKMCGYVKVPYKDENFLNSGLTIGSEPDDFSNVTMRTVLGWIAEAAASNARFNRDGLLVMDWYRSTNQSYAETDYSEFEPYWYETKKIDKLYNRKTSEGTDVTVGTGSNAYVIQDNPFLN